MPYAALHPCTHPGCPILTQSRRCNEHQREERREHLAPREDDAPTVVSLFAGCGGSSLGYSMAAYRERRAVEWDDHAVETFKLNFPGVPVWQGDIADLSVDECLRLMGLKPGELDVLDGSPPCQGFSTAGKRKMDDGRNQLLQEYVRLLRGLRPKVFVMENVSGMVKECVSYCTSRSFSGKAVLTRLLPGDICFRSSSIHIMVRRIIEPLILVVIAPASREDTLPPPIPCSPHSGSHFGCHLFGRQ